MALARGIDILRAKIKSGKKRIKITDPKTGKVKFLVRKPKVKNKIKRRRNVV